MWRKSTKKYYKRFQLSGFSYQFSLFFIFHSSLFILHYSLFTIHYFGHSGTTLRTEPPCCRRACSGVRFAPVLHRTSLKKTQTPYEIVSRRSFRFAPASPPSTSLMHSKPAVLNWVLGLMF